ncbi:MAG TPA: hypothetical protein VM510_09065 [Caulifigura sp.]|nr:hypothetical protein [Caulifigura sp.]
MLQCAVRQLVVAAALGAAGWTPIQAAPRPVTPLHDQLQGEYEARHRDFEKRVLSLATEAESFDAAEAQRLRSLAKTPDDASLQLLSLPNASVPEPPRELPEAHRNLLLRLRSLEADYANDLYKLGIRAKAKVETMSVARRLILEAVYRNPDHEPARALIGYVKFKNEWMTPFRREMLKRGNVWHDEFGWVRSEDLPKYLAGEERTPDGRWLKKDRVAAIRSDFANAWEVNSEHFHVRCNVSLEKAVALSVQLERFHEYFLREFADVFMTSTQQMKALFPGGSVNADRYDVHYFRNRNEFKEWLIMKQPEAAFSDGLYLKGIAYFFDRPGEEGKVAQTMYHEITHQILTESQTKPVKVDNWTDGDFWLVEGLACYLESFRPEGRGGSVGDPRHVRIEWARRFAIEEGFYIPLENFTAMNQHDFQCANMANGPARVDRLQHHYAQAAGVTNFFMHYRNGQYRDALITYLAQIYSADQRMRKNNETLADLTGVPFKELDRQYIEYVRGLETGG